MHFQRVFLLFSLNGNKKQDGKRYENDDEIPSSLKKAQSSDSLFFCRFVQVEKKIRMDFKKKKY